MDLKLLAMSAVKAVVMVVLGVSVTAAIMWICSHLWDRWGNCGNYLIFYCVPLTAILTAVCYARSKRERG